MPFYRGLGGSIHELDLPSPNNQNAVELRAHQIAKGDLVEVPAERVRRVETVVSHDGNGNPVIGVTFVEIDDDDGTAADASPSPAKSRVRRPDPEAERPNS